MSNRIDIDKTISCNNCGMINITEELQQVHNEISHRCILYRRKLLHHSSTRNIIHEMIYPCSECIADGYKHYMEVKR
jgi:epoxyqueuosine reductase QueG